MAMKSKKSKETEQEQPKTRYDRKMEARKKQAAKDKLAATVARTVGILVLVAAIGTCGYFLTNYIIKDVKATHDPYLKVGEHELSQVEYDYYYNASVNTYLNNYGSILSYMGLDTSLPFEDQEYSEDMTWKDYFEQMAISQLSQEYALYDDALANSYEYDTTEDYEEFLTNIKDTAKNESQSLGSYVKTSFGEHATLHRIKPYVERSSYVSNYYNQLLEDNAPSEEEIEAYYNEHQTEYDQVTYYSFAINESNYTDDSEDTDTDDSDASTEAAYEAAKADAEAMYERVKKGEDFEALCYEYAPESAKDSYNTGDGENSLTTKTTSTSINSDFVDWLYNDTRKEGDSTLIEDEAIGVFYVLKFVSKEYDENCKDTISSSLSSETTNNYVDELSEAYEATDIKGEIGYLSSTEADTSEEETSESLLNTDIIE